MIITDNTLNKIGSHESKADINKGINGKYDKEGNIYIVPKHLLTKYLLKGNKTRSTE